MAVFYSQKIAAIATGGTPPYRWSVAGSLPPGLDFASDTLTLAGTPQTAGTFTFSLQVTDSAQQTASKSHFARRGSGIPDDHRLPGVAGGRSQCSLFRISFRSRRGYALHLVGCRPSRGPANRRQRRHHQWNSGRGRQLRRRHHHQRLGVEPRVGPFYAQDQSSSDPEVRLTGLPATADPASQYPISVSIASAFPAPINGQAVLTFSPESGPTDRTVQFASGGTIANFSIPAGSTTATATVPLAIQTGTVAGSINVSIRLQAGGIDITPLPSPTMTAQVSRAAPVIQDVRVSRSEGKVTLVVSGYSTSREVTQATFTFGAGTGQTLQPTASSLVVSTETLFNSWFQDAANSAYGSQFVLSQPFTINGDSNAVIPQSVMLTNRTGSTTFRLP